MALQKGQNHPFFYSLSVSSAFGETLVERAPKGCPSRFASFAEARDRFEFDYISSLMHTTEGNVAQSARLAQRNRSEFYKLLKKHKLAPAQYRPAGGT